MHKLTRNITLNLSMMLLALETCGDQLRANIQVSCKRLEQAGLAEPTGTS